MKSPGLRGRLVLTTVLAALGAVSILVVGLQVLLEHMTDADSVDVLHSRADAAAATVRGGPGHVKVLDSPSDSLDQNIWIFDLHGRMVDGNSPTQVLAPAVGALSKVRSQEIRSVAERYRHAQQEGRDAKGRLHGERHQHQIGSRAYGTRCRRLDPDAEDLASAR